MCISSGEYHTSGRNLDLFIENLKSGLKEVKEFNNILCEIKKVNSNVNIDK